MWIMVVAALGVPYCPSSSSIALLDVFPMITSGLRGFTGQFCLNSALVVMPFARAHSRALQSWSVTPVKSKISSSARMPLPPPHPMATAFGSIGAESSEWARDLCPTGLVSTGGKFSVKVTAVSTVRGSTLLLLMPPIPR